MRDEDIIKALDRIEADMRGLETKCFRLRTALRERIDPNKWRKDLGYWPDEDTESAGLRPKVGA